MILYRHDAARSCVQEDDLSCATAWREGHARFMVTTPPSLLPSSIEVVDDDATLTAHAGLPLVLETMRALGVSDEIGRAIAIRQRDNGLTDTPKIEGIVLLLAAGGTRMEDIEVLRVDKGLLRLVGPLPSNDVVRTFLCAFHDESLIEKAKRWRCSGPSSAWRWPIRTATGTCLRRWATCP